MAVGSVYFYLITALVAVNLIFADDSLFSDSNQVDFNEVAHRKERSPQEDAENRFLLFPLIGVCNYTATPGSSCASCRQAQVCLANNNAILRYCRGLLPYCNNGRCSFIPDPVACNGTVAG